MAQAKIAASVLNADFSNWKKWLPELEAANADRIQWDIMDGKFVANTGVDKKYISMLKPRTKIFFESHLMVQKPEEYVEEFSENGTKLLIFHIEATKEPLRLIERIEDFGMKVGMAINSKTPAEKLFPFLDKLDLGLVMGVDAGFGGQKFQENALQKISLLRGKIDSDMLDCKIEVDGGINPLTGKQCVEAGCDILVAGSFIFRHPEGIARAISELRKI